MSEAKEYTYGGETHTLTEWAEKMGVSRFTLKSRLTRGWSIEKVLTTPIILERKSQMHTHGREKSSEDGRVKFIEYNGKRQSIREWADEFGMSASGLWYRLKNMPLEKALNPQELSKKKREACTAHDWRECFNCKFPD